MTDAAARLIHDEFERVWPWLAASLAPAAYVHDGIVYPTHNQLHVWQRIATGKAKLWAFSDSAILTEFIHHPTGLRSQNTWLAGGELAQIAERMPLIEAWGYAHGCHRQIGNGRRGWLKVFTGYHEYGVRKQKDLLAPGASPQLHQ
jgi:hypothetical protein